MVDGGAPMERESLARLVRDADPLLSPAAVDAAVARLDARIAGLGPLEVLMVDPHVTEVMVNGPGPVWTSAAAGSYGPLSCSTRRPSSTSSSASSPRWVDGPIRRRLWPTPV